MYAPCVLWFTGKHQNQHLQLGEDSQAELQTQTFSHQIARQNWGEDAPWMLMSLHLGTSAHTECVVFILPSLCARTLWSSPWPVEMCVSPSGRPVWSTTPSSDCLRNPRQYKKRCCSVRAPALDTGKAEMWIYPVLVFPLLFLSYFPLCLCLLCEVCSDLSSSYKLFFYEMYQK